MTLDTAVPNAALREMRKVVSTPHRNRARTAQDRETPSKSTDSQKLKIKLVCGNAHSTFHAGGSMRLRNTTDIADATVREILAFVCPPGVAAYDVSLRNGRGYHMKGRAYPEGAGRHRGERGNVWLVTLYVGEATLFPRGPRTPVRSNYLPQPFLASREEALVYIAAHELRHLWQGRVPRGRRVWGARGQYSERDADAYATRMLRAWRRADLQPRFAA